jgi:acyl-CoA thioester hydrolase
MSSSRSHTTHIRVRYSETDQMGTFYNSRALEWFECGRTELLRSLGLGYARIESRGIRLPLVEAHLQFRGRARYDDLLEVETELSLSGRARLRFDVRIRHADGGPAVTDGWTLHAVTGEDGRVVRPPDWLLELIG